MSTTPLSALPLRDQLAYHGYFDRKVGKTEAQIRNSLDCTLTYFPNLKPHLYGEAKAYGIEGRFYDAGFSHHTDEEKEQVSEMVERFGEKHDTRRKTYHQHRSVSDE